MSRHAGSSYSRRRSDPDPPSDDFPFIRPLMRLMPTILGNQGFDTTVLDINGAVKFPIWFSRYPDPDSRGTPYDPALCGSFHLVDLAPDKAQAGDMSRNWRERLAVALKEACSAVSVDVHESAYHGIVWAAFVPARCKPPTVVPKAFVAKMEDAVRKGFTGFLPIFSRPPACSSTSPFGSLAISRSMRVCLVAKIAALTGVSGAVK